MEKIKDWTVLAAEKIGRTATDGQITVLMIEEIARKLNELVDAHNKTVEAIKALSLMIDIAINSLGHIDFHQSEQEINKILNS